ncbi:MAG TPA: SulP family inorganic anion transporter, partial [Alphaproteobacteria bacterium]|nr:SulP family inorganic anion transporter [Alphaproteobacteria bacterium]
MLAQPNYLRALPHDLSAGVVVFLVALPLCLGIALASGAPLLSGLVSGIVGGLLVAWLSGSHTSVSGPAAGLTAVVAAQIQALGSFEAFLVAVVVAGAIQVGLGLMRMGALAVFFPSSVIKGLLSAIGIILILKQIPHLFGHDPDWLGDMSFRQVDGANTFTEIFATIFDVHPGATVVGLGSLALLLVWDRTPLKNSIVPGPLFVVVAGVAMAVGLEQIGGAWQIAGAHLVQVPVTESLSDFAAALPTPDFSAITH